MTKLPHLPLSDGCLFATERRARQSARFIRAVTGKSSLTFPARVNNRQLQLAAANRERGGAPVAVVTPDGVQTIPFSRAMATCLLTACEARDTHAA